MFVKICGTTSEEDALLAVALGADAVGFVFAPSPRQIAPVVAGDISKRLPREIVTVGVFRDESRERVVRTVNELGLRGAQLHGRESQEDVRWVGERVPFVIKAFPAGHADVACAGDYGADAVLLDGPSPGSGQVFDWRLAEGGGSSTRLVLSGGLNPGNVAGAIGQVHPWGVDVATGVEERPGRKDPRKLRFFIDAVRAASPSSYDPSGEGPYDWQEDPGR